MARRITRGRSFVRGVRSATDWSASAVSTALTSIAASTVLLHQVFTPIAGGETVLRSRGMFYFGSDQSAAIEETLGAVGIGIVSEQAATVGVTAVPHPDTDAAWGGWLWHSYFAARTQVASAIGFEQSLQHIVIDSKGMRKIGENERLIMVVANSSSFGMLMTMSARFLTKVH